MFPRQQVAGQRVKWLFAAKAVDNSPVRALPSKIHGRKNKFIIPTLSKLN